MTTDAMLDRVREYRRAARRIVRADWVGVEQRCLGLLELQDAAKADEDLTARTWAERAIWEESKVFLGVDDGEPFPPPRSYEAAQRQLRREGYQHCPRCRAALATEDDFVHWSRLRLADADRRDAREEAVNP